MKESGLTEEKVLERLKEHLEKHLGWGVPSLWHSSMFTELSEKIFDKCQIMLNPATLKRFWGVVNHDGSPSISTLDTLSQFVGFANWRDFKLSSNSRGKIRFSPPVPGRFFYVTAGFLLAIIVVFLIGNQRANDPTDLSTITFSSRPVTNSYPNSVVFDFDLQNIKSDSLYIQQYWDPTKTIKLSQDQNQATGIYYFPGYFRAKLVINGKPVQEHDLFLKSNGWMGTLDYEPVPKYFTPERFEQVGLTFPENLLTEVKNLNEPLLSTYHYVDDLGNISGDDFTLKSSIRVTYKEKWAVCQAAKIYVLGTTGAMIIPFSKVGCSSDNSLMLNDIYKDGKEHDLSAFGVDLSGFTNIQLKVNNKKVSVFINGSKVYSSEYQASMGKLVGLRFKFLGLGEIEHFSLRDRLGFDVVQ